MYPQAITVKGLFILLISVSQSFGKKNIFCRYGTKSHLSSLNPFLCTHIVYHGAYPQYDGSVHFDESRMRYLRVYKQTNSQLKVMLEIGGYQHYYEQFYSILKSKSIRNNFAKHIINLAKWHNFDGVHLMWGDRVTFYSKLSDEEIKNYSLLLEELRTLTTNFGLLLTSLINVVETKIISYDITKVVKNLDFIVLFILKRSSANTTYHDNELTYIKTSINNAISIGIPEKKILAWFNVGSRTFKLVHSTRHALGSLADLTGNFSYSEMCQIQSRGIWTNGWDDTEKVPYIFSDTDWISYENSISISVKVKFLMEKNLAGMFIALARDDYNNFCHNGYYPILNQINLSMAENNIPSTSNNNKNLDALPSASTNICKFTGYVSDPDNCDKFHYCTRNENGTFRALQFMCPNGLIVDEKLLVCNYLYIFGNEDS